MYCNLIFAVFAVGTVLINAQIKYEYSQLKKFDIIKQ